MIVDSYLVNQTPTQSHNSSKNPSNTAVNFELEKMQPSEVTLSTHVLNSTKTTFLGRRYPRTHWFGCFDRFLLRPC